MIYNLTSHLAKTPYGSILRFAGKTKIRSMQYSNGKDREGHTCKIQPGSKNLSQQATSEDLSRVKNSFFLVVSADVR